MYSCEPLHMDKQRLNDQLEPINNSSVPIQDIVWRTYQERWIIETSSKRIREIQANSATWWGMFNWRSKDQLISDNTIFFLQEGFLKFISIYQNYWLSNIIQWHWTTMIYFCLKMAWIKKILKGELLVLHRE